MTLTEILAYAAPVGLAVQVSAGLVWRFMASRTKAADDATAALIVTLREDGAAARAERDHERDERARERAEAAAMTADLGRRLDRLRAKAEADAATTAVEIAKIATPEQMADGSVWAEMPTMVRNRCEVAAAAVSPSVLPARESARLGRYARGEALSTPPGGTVPPKLPAPPRPRQR